MQPFRSIVIVPALIGVLALTTACNQAAQEDTTQRDADGDVVEGGDIGVFRLQEGDCLELPTSIDDEGAVIEDLSAVPCDQPHSGEVVLVDDEYFADLDAFPGEQASLEQGTQRCIEALDAYTGTDYESSNFDVLVLGPTEASWDALDDRGLVCIGITLDDTLSESMDTTGSIRSGG